MARDDGIRGAHARWHIPPEGNPSPKCPICVREYKKARGSDGVPHRGAQKGAIAKEEKEPQVEKEPEKEPETITEYSTSLREAMPDEPRIEAVIHTLADRFRMDDTA